jgi:hypothetical protein
MPDQVRHDRTERMKDREQLDNGRKAIWTFEKVRNKHLHKQYTALA